MKMRRVDAHVLTCGGLREMTVRGRTMLGRLANGGMLTVYHGRIGRRRIQGHLGGRHIRNFSRVVTLGNRAVRGMPVPTNQGGQLTTQAQCQQPISKLVGEVTRRIGVGAHRFMMTVISQPHGL
mmetsp:Transcript_132447/g.264286  ORF Transcript_132447/g.264286 Transcript_132447/m.264286 type:complete len:124 (+) Transcript_132447:129-500(+)